MQTIKADKTNKKDFKITKSDVPIFMVSIDMRHATKARFTVVTEYLPQPTYQAMSAMPVKKTYKGSDGKLHHYRGTFYSSHSDGEIELGYESGISVSKLPEAQNPNVPHVSVSSFVARIACEYDSSILKDCIDYLLDFAESLSHTGVQDDKIMGNQNYAMNLRALNEIDLVTSAKVPLVTVKNALPTLDKSYKIFDLYKQIKKPLNQLIRTAYLVPPIGYSMYVFNNGVSKLRSLTKAERAKRKSKIAKTYINWPTMQKIRLKQKQIAKVVKRPLHKDK